MDIKEAFEFFIVNYTTASKSVEKYIGALKKVSESLQTIPDAGVSQVWAIENYEEGIRIKNLLDNDPEFIEYNTNRGHNMYSSAFSWFLKFLQAKELFTSKLNAKTSEEIMPISDTTAKGFAKKTFSFLYSLDKFKAFWSEGKIETRKEQDLKIQYFSLKNEDENINLSGLFRADSVPMSAHYAKEIPFEIDGHRWFLPTIWYRDILSSKNNRNPYPIESLLRLVNRYYPQFKASENNGTYILQKTAESSTVKYEDIKNYWNYKESRQVIYFGAPGTGKSFEINKIVKEKAPKHYIRTTFHPDTDYSSFVGCYKPSMRNGNIEYTFIAQSFMNAYIEAWSDITKPFYLVIEEINRGNCAQIFGDIFQLLDRNQDGESSYGIKPDTDLQNYIDSQLNLLTYIPEEIRRGEEMRLPGNLFIYATMNTSDQSLFPIDSAFKRRWDMRYTAIKPGDVDHILIVGAYRYNWTSFINEVNKRIFNLTKSQDKQLGYWFIKPNELGEIDWKTLVSKAIFYIWNDIVKDYATMEKEDSPFGKKFAFTTFYNEHGEPIMEQTIAFLEKLGVEKLPAI